MPRCPGVSGLLDMPEEKRLKLMREDHPSRPLLSGVLQAPPGESESFRESLAGDSESFRESLLPPLWCRPPPARCFEEACRGEPGEESGRRRRLESGSRKMLRGS